MEILAIVLIIYGVFVLAGILLQFPFFYNNPKSKLLIRKMGKTGFNIMLMVFGLVALIFGIVILT